jgi:hypothetical protein
MLFYYFFSGAAGASCLAGSGAAGASCLAGSGAAGASCLAGSAFLGSSAFSQLTTAKENVNKKISEKIVENIFFIVCSPPFKNLYCADYHVLDFIFPIMHILGYFSTKKESSH